MSNYKAIFKLGGIDGEVKLTAQNDGEAFMTACKVFASFKNVKWHIEKLESIFDEKKAIKEAVDDVTYLQDNVYSLWESQDVKKSKLSEEDKEGDRGQMLDEIKENLEEANEYLIASAKCLTKAKRLMI